MTQHDAIRKERALNCDRDNLESLSDAIRGLQSTDAPSLTPLHDELMTRYNELVAKIKPVENPIVSVDRASKSIAAFDGPEIVHDFIPYTNEEAAITSMNIWLAFRKSPTSSWPPRVVHPRITKICMS